MKPRTFKKGIHPEEFKSFTESKTLETMPLPKEVFIPLQQHIGAPCKPIVEKKMPVKVGQVIGESTGFVSSPVHATISGTVQAVEMFQHPIGAPAAMIHIKGDGSDEWIEGSNVEVNWKDFPPNALINMIQRAGIVGLGGAGFPTHVKLSPPEGKLIDALVLNGCECEPYLTADHRIMVECPDGIVIGTQIIMKALGVKRAFIGIEVNKPDAIAAMQRAAEADPEISVVPLKVKYPQGAEKMLIKAVLNREVPAGKLPMDVGVVVNNVATAVAAAEAVIKRKPLIERIVTVTGSGIKQPKNVVARIGAPFQDLIDFCGGLLDESCQVIMGGPMMGVTQYSLKVPIVKATSGILCLTDDAVIEEEQYPCIRCGNCVTACPAALLPTRLAALTRNDNIDAAEQLGILNCVECGSCAFVCPSRIPLVQWLRVGKLKAAAARKKRQNQERSA